MTMQKFFEGSRALRCGNFGEVLRILYGRPPQPGDQAYVSDGYLHGDLRFHEGNGKIKLDRKDV